MGFKAALKHFARGEDEVLARLANEALGGLLTGKKAAVVAPDPERAASATTSKYWGVCWCKKGRRWKASYLDANGKNRHIGYFDTQEQAAHAVNAAIRRAGLEGRRKTNPVDTTGALVPREYVCDRSAVVAPDPSRAPTETTSKFWGVSWNKSARRWNARYKDADGKLRHIGLFDTQEPAAHAVNAAIRRAGLEGRRKTNPVVDGRLVPRALKAKGHGPKALRKRRREEAAAAIRSLPADVRRRRTRTRSSTGSSYPSTAA